MGALFRFFLFVFICFVAAKFLLQALGVVSRQYLVGLTVVLLANLYWLRYLVFRDRGEKGLLALELKSRKQEAEKPGTGESPGGTAS